MTPMFVETQVVGGGGSMAAGEDNEDVTDGGGDASLATGEVRATQDAQFSATQGSLSVKRSKVVSALSKFIDQFAFGSWQWY